MQHAIATCYSFLVIVDNIPQIYTSEAGFLVVPCWISKDKVHVGSVMLCNYEAFHFTETKPVLINALYVWSHQYQLYFLQTFFSHLYIVTYLSVFNILKLLSLLIIFFQPSIISLLFLTKFILNYKILLIIKHMHF